jgi:hypothetical protein
VPFKSKHVSVSISRPVDQVYAFASNPKDWPRWAEGLSDSIENVNGEWIAESPMGTLKVQFTASNEFGVLDHRVTLASGETIYNPMRVFPNNNGSEVVFTVYQRPHLSAETFAQDTAAVQRDLETLKRLLEQ